MGCSTPATLLQPLLRRFVPNIPTFFLYAAAYFIFAAAYFIFVMAGETRGGRSPATLYVLVYSRLNAGDRSVCSSVLILWIEGIFCFQWSEEESRNHKVSVTEILRFALNDNYFDYFIPLAL